LTFTFVAKRTQPIVGPKLYQKVGELVVKFNELDDSLRCAVSAHVSPGIDDIICQGVFSRVRFNELVDMYQIVGGFMIDQAQTEEDISEAEADKLGTELRLVCKQLARINERRNTIVHSAYFEDEIVDESGNSVGRILAASKPNRNALDLTETFNPFVDVEKEITEANLQVGHTYQEFLRFDRALLLHVNLVWIRFSQRTLDMKDRGIDLTRARLQFPGLRIGHM
jgi:hypothetical protein